MTKISELILKPGKEKAVLNRHPWIFSGAIAREPAAAPGEIVRVVKSTGEFLAWAYYNKASQIRARALSWDPDEGIDGAWWRRMIERAVTARRSLIDSRVTNAVRLVHGESDFLPGLIVDQYGDFIILQALTAGIDRHLPLIVEALVAVTKPRGVFERSDEAVREYEGLAQKSGVLWGEAPPASGIEVRENGFRLIVDGIKGHKTGFYLDQRSSRSAVASFAQGKSVLNCFSYTGAFSVACAAAGATSITNIESSESALAAAQQNMDLNDLTTPYEGLCGDVFAELRKYRENSRTFDLIILDPPKFAHNKSQVDKACRGYKDINRIAMALLNPGGLLATFSCSGLISADLFQKVIFGASIDAKTPMQIIQRLQQPADHPVLLTFPEGDYLKGLLCRRVQ